MKVSRNGISVLSGQSIALIITNCLKVFYGELSASAMAFVFSTYSICNLTPLVTLKTMFNKHRLFGMNHGRCVVLKRRLPVSVVPLPVNVVSERRRATKLRSVSWYKAWIGPF